MNGYKSLYNSVDIQASSVSASVAEIDDLNIDTLSISGGLNLPFLTPSRVVQTDGSNNLTTSNNLNNITLSGTTNINSLTADKLLKLDGSKNIISDTENYVTESSLAATLLNYVLTSYLVTVLLDYVTNSSLVTTLLDYVTNSSLATTLLNYFSLSGNNTITGNNTISGANAVPKFVVYNNTSDMVFRIDTTNKLIGFGGPLRPLTSDVDIGVITSKIRDIYQLGNTFHTGTYYIYDSTGAISHSIYGTTSMNELVIRVGSSGGYLTVRGELMPFSDNTHAIGDTLLKWLVAYITTIYTTTINSTTINSTSIYLTGILSITSTNNANKFFVSENGGRKIFNVDTSTNTVTFLGSTTTSKTAITGSYLLVENTTGFGNWGQVVISGSHAGNITDNLILTNIGTGAGTGTSIKFNGHNGSATVATIQFQGTHMIYNTASGGDHAFSSNVRSTLNNTHNCGASSQRWLNTYSQNYNGDTYNVATLLAATSNNAVDLANTTNRLRNIYLTQEIKFYRVDNSTPCLVNLDVGNVRGRLWSRFNGDTGVSGDWMYLTYNYYVNSAGTLTVDNGSHKCSRLIVGATDFRFGWSSTAGTVPTDRLILNDANSSLYPATNNTLALGTSSLRYSNIYGVNIRCYSSHYITDSAGSFTHQIYGEPSTNELVISTNPSGTAGSLIVKGKLYPQANDTYIVGTSGRRWLQVYSRDIVCDDVIASDAVQCSSLAITGTHATTIFSYQASGNIGNATLIKVNNVNALFINSSGDGQFTGSSVYKASGLSFSNPSDRRLKQNIINFNDGLNIVNKIRCREFEYKNNPGKKVKGVIAQEMLDVYPECISKNEDGYYSFDANDIIFMLINSVQELTEEIRKLKLKNNN